MNRQYHKFSLPSKDSSSYHKQEWTRVQMDLVGTIQSHLGLWDNPGLCNPSGHCVPSCACPPRASNHNEEEETRAPSPRCEVCQLSDVMTSCVHLHTQAFFTARLFIQKQSFPLSFQTHCWMVCLKFCQSGNWSIKKPEYKMQQSWRISMSVYCFPLVSK